MIKEIDIKSVITVRHLVLRKGKPIETCHFVNDEKRTTKHFGLLIDDKVIGVVSLFGNKNVLFKDKKQFQIRGMAVLEEYQHKGFGKLLIEKAEKTEESKPAKAKTVKEVKEEKSKKAVVKKAAPKKVAKKK